MTSEFSDVQGMLRAVAEGGVVAIPTDTVYGLACHPADDRAVERVYEIKRRPQSLELTLLGSDAAAFAGLVELTEQARRLARHFWPGPLSIVLRAGPLRLAVPRGGSTVSCRVPAHALLRDLLAASGPLASTSANRHGQPPATTAAQVLTQLGDDVDAILDGGPANGVASTIIDCATTPPRVLREGPISGDELFSYLGGSTAASAGAAPANDESSEGHQRRERHQD